LKGKPEKSKNGFLTFLDFFNDYGLLIR